MSGLEQAIRNALARSESIDAEARARRAQTHKQDLLDKVRGFLGFDE